MWKLSHYAIVEAVEPFKLHPTSMSYIYKVFEHLLRIQRAIKLYERIKIRQEITVPRSSFKC